ncbi:LysR family transcriptional regulator [Gilvimarinus sp. F26214L]|uniref:LysR family transcriptional regulator n=1 Tax=Gilvimarinus sp. DZF01 TaxID=3461371 RepID=UPI0040466142
MDPIPNLRHLHALLAVSRHGSISAASAQVHLSQPAITQALNRVEAALGTPLFQRSVGGMTPTGAGRVFLARVDRALRFLHIFNNARRPPFTTTQLRALTAVVEYGNISIAAAKLGLAQPSVHRAAREAEEVAGDTLFIRSGSGVNPTPTAKRLARLASQTFAELRQAQEEVAEHLGTVNGSLRIGSLPLARTDLVPSSVNRLLQRYPDARISIVDGPYEELLDMLLHGRVDLIVGALRQPPPTREVRETLLFDDPLAVVARPDHPLLARKRLNLETIAKHEWVAPRQGTPARQRFQSLFADRGLRPPERLIECSSSMATRALLLESDRIALLSSRQVLPEIRHGMLCTLPVPLDVSRPIGVTVRRAWHPTAMQAEYLSSLQRLSGKPTRD